MGRTEYPMARRGSQRWLQLAVNRRSGLLNDYFRRELDLLPGENITWRSPLEEDYFAEYRDGDFLARLGVDLKRQPLRDFWPVRGPVWDGLAITETGRVILVEAKANVPELDSSPTKAGPASLLKIEKSMNEVRDFLRVRSKTDWTSCFYQYANRLAHLYLLRELNGIDAHLVFLYFLNDTTRSEEDPVSREGWETAVSLAKTHLGIRQSQPWLSANVADVFVDVNDLSEVPWAAPDS